MILWYNNALLLCFVGDFRALIFTEQCVSDDALCEVTSWFADAQTSIVIDVIIDVSSVRFGGGAII